MKAPEFVTDNKVGRKTPDEIKKGLLCCSHSDMSCSECPYDGLCNTDSGETPEDDAAGLIDQLLSSYSQVSKALCGKGNATHEEVLQAARQVKKRIFDLEYALALMVSQYCRDSEGYLTHLWMTAGEKAFEALGIENYSIVDIVDEMIDRMEEIMKEE